MSNLLSNGRRQSQSLSGDIEQYSSMVTSNNAGHQEEGFSRWLNYTAVAGSVLAMSSTVDAAVIYSGIQNLTLPNGQNPQIDIDMNGDLINDFAFYTFFSNTDSYGYAAVKAGTNGVAINGQGLFADKLSTGDIIDSRLAFLQNGKEALFRSVSTDGGVYANPRAEWGATSTGIMAAKLNVNSDSYFAWIRVALSEHGNGYPDDITVIDWAYENTGAGLIAGSALDLSPPPPDVSAVPLPGSLGLLASGVAGLATFRKRRRSLVTKKNLK